jgi:hypothetical protein
MIYIIAGLVALFALITIAAAFYFMNSPSASPILVKELNPTYPP